MTTTPGCFGFRTNWTHESSGHMDDIDTMDSSEGVRFKFWGNCPSEVGVIPLRVIPGRLKVGCGAGFFF